MHQKIVTQYDSNNTSITNNNIMFVISVHYVFPRQWTLRLRARVRQKIIHYSSIHFSFLLTFCNDSIICKIRKYCYVSQFIWWSAQEKRLFMTAVLGISKEQFVLTRLLHLIFLYRSLSLRLSSFTLFIYLQIPFSYAIYFAKHFH